jgi:hypothetical protein
VAASAPAGGFGLIGDLLGTKREQAALYTAPSIEATAAAAYGWPLGPRKPYSASSAATRPGRIWPAIGVVPSLPCQIGHLRVPLGVAFTAAALFPSGYFAIMGRLELGDRGGLVEFGSGTKHLADLW